MRKFDQKNNGYAILELLFYISLFAILCLLVINSMIVMTKSFREISIEAEVVQSGNIIESISREVRQAYGIDPSSTNTDLKLNTKDSAGADKTVEFLLSGTNLEFLENGALTGNLNTPNIEVTALSFTEINTAKSKAVKIFITVSPANDSEGRSFDFYDSVVLRGSYQSS